MGESLSKICCSSPKMVIMDSTIIKKEVEEELMVTHARKHLTKENSEVFKPSTFISKAVIRNMYYFLDEIGAGAFASVHKAHLKKDKEGKRFFAVKIMQKKGNKEDIKRMIKEIELMKKMDHPVINRIYEAYENKLTYSIVMEYCTGGALSSLIELQNSAFNEGSTRDVIFQALQAINYLHQKGIVHRDIKAENFLIVKTGFPEMKLIDFGLATTVSSLDAVMTECVGSPFYLAPEVLEKSYTSKCDLWSTGVMMFILMTGELPYDCESNTDMFEHIREGKLDRGLIEKSNYSSEAKDLLSKLLIREKDGRLSALQGIQHPWFKPNHQTIREKGQKYLTKELLLTLRSFSYKSLFQREMISLIVQFLEGDSKQVEELQAVFTYLDEDFSGSISSEELKLVYARYGIELSSKEVFELVDSLYFRERAVITYLEFIAATLSPSEYKTEARIRQLFDYIDTNSSGDIDKFEIQDCFLRFGRDLTESKVARMLEETGAGSVQTINFTQFYNLIQKGSLH